MNSVLTVQVSMFPCDLGGSACTSYDKSYFDLCYAQVALGRVALVA